MRLGFIAGAVACAATGFVVVSLAIDANQTKPLAFEYAFTFTHGSKDAKLLSSGWSAPEFWGVWSTERRAELMVPLVSSPLGPIQAEFEGRSMSPPGDPGGQVVRVLVNSSLVATLRFNREDEIRYGKFAIPQALAASQKPMQIALDISRPTSPLEAGQSTDPRKLGIAISRLTLRYRPAEVFQSDSSNVTRVKE